MALFGKPKTGGFMDEIRCDEPSYLIWKWHPKGARAGSNNRENAIRRGSSLRVKDGEAAVFVYSQENGILQDFIEGPFDQIIETENFPVLAGLIGLAYEGGTPFQAEVYFINLAKVIQIPFGVPFFDVYDPRFLDFGVPVAVRGRITFHISDYREFIKLHRLSNFDLNTFQTQIREAVSRYVKAVITNVPSQNNIPVVWIEREISRINALVEENIKGRLEQDFGVHITAVDISAVELDKASDGYMQLKAVTQDVAAAAVRAQSEADVQNIHDIQRIKAENMEEILRIQREEDQYARRKQTQSSNFAAFQMEKQAEVGIAGAQALGQMSAGGAAGMSDGGGMNMAGMMAGMAMGGAVGQNMAGVMNQMMGGMNFVPQAQSPSASSPSMASPSAAHPPMASAAYHVAVNGQATGPYDIPALVQMAAMGTFTKSSLVWKQGMADWADAGSVQELQSVFENEIPPVPKAASPVPPT